MHSICPTGTKNIVSEYHLLRFGKESLDIQGVVQPYNCFSLGPDGRNSASQLSLFVAQVVGVLGDAIFPLDQ
jgi:hypothetical protein